MNLTEKGEYSQKLKIRILSIIYGAGDNGISYSQICSELNLETSSVSRTWKNLKDDKLIWKKGYGCFELFEKGKTELENYLILIAGDKTINIHAFRISFDLIKDKSEENFWDKYTQMKNWIKKIKKTSFGTVIGNTKTIEIYLKSVDISNLEEIYQLILIIMVVICPYLKYNGLNICRPKTTSIHFFMYDKILEKIIDKKISITSNLTRCAKTPFENKNKTKAFVLTDNTPARGMEFNDITYLLNYLMVPENIDKLLKLNTKLAENDQKQLSVLDSIEQILKSIRDTLKNNNNVAENRIIERRFV